MKNVEEKILTAYTVEMLITIKMRYLSLLIYGMLISQASGHNTIKIQFNILITKDAFQDEQCDSVLNEGVSF